MNAERSAPSTRATITLQGGGRLAGVSRVLKVRLEAQDVEWRPAGRGVLAVRGVIHSYVYFMRAGSRVVEGEGFSIPFSREVAAVGLDLNRVDVQVEELLSDYDFDPPTADFQHRITVILRVRQTPAENDAGSDTEAASSAPPVITAPETRGSADARAAAAATDPSPAETTPAGTRNFGTGRAVEKVKASGEIRFSQVRTGPSHSDQPEGEVVEASPSSPAPPSPQSSPQKEDGGEKSVLVWKPFPPPIES